MGALMGSTVGLCMGLVFGTFNILRYGAGPKGFLGTLSQYMLSSAATFGFFMSIGSVIRTQERIMAPNSQYPRWKERNSAILAAAAESQRRKNV